MGRRVLITGLASFWGGLVAKALEEDDSVEVIVGLDTREPTVELERTEYVRSDENYSILSRIVQATRVDTIVHTFLIIDSTTMRARTMHEINVIGTMNLFAAASAPGSTVRDVVVKSSSYVYGTAMQDPVWFSEETQRTNPARNRVEQSIESVEGYVRDFAEDNPHVNVTLLRFSNVLGPDIVTPISRALELPLVPSIFGFDPRFQFVHEDDVVRSILFVLDRHLPGIYNVAGDGLLPWSEVAAPLRQAHRRRCRPIATGLATWPLRQIGVPLPRRAARPAALRPRHRQPPAEGSRASATTTRRPARWRPSSRRCACATPSARPSRPTATSATSSSSSATPPPWSATAVTDLRDATRASPVRGTIATSVADSTAWWPEATPAGGRLAQRRGHRARRRGLRRPRLLRLRDRHAHHRPPGRRRPALHRVPHHAAVLADPGVPAHRPQPPQRRHVDGGRVGRRLPRRPQPHHPGRGHRWPRCCATPATPPCTSASGTSPRPTSRPRSARSTTGRSARASSAPTASSRATPTSSTPTWCRTTRSSRRPAPRPRATTSPRTCSTTPTASSRDHVALAPDRRSSSTWRSAPATGRCRPRPSSSRSTAAATTAGGTRCGPSGCARQQQLGIVPESAALPPRNDGVEAWDDLTDDQRRVRGPAAGGLRRLPRPHRHAARPGWSTP